MSKTVVALLMREETLTYALDVAPVLHDVGAMRLSVQPFKLALFSRDGALRVVTATGLTVRRDGGRGAHRQAVWTVSDGWAGMPPWVAGIVNRAPVKWEAPS